MKQTCLLTSLAVTQFCLVTASSITALSITALAAEETAAGTATTVDVAPNTTAEISSTTITNDTVPVPGNWEVYIENDSLALGQRQRTDRFYTSGIRLRRTYANLHTGKVNAGPAFADKLVTRLLKHSPYRQRSIVLGQNFYTPSDVTVAAVIPDDRPYAGWLYAGMVWTGYRTPETSEDTGAARRRDISESVELDLGVVGPLSLAESFQKQFHNSVGSRPPKGWDNQLNNEPGIILSYQHNRRPIFIGAPKAFGLDATSSVGADAGNIFTQAKLGTMVRLGYNVPRDFHAGTTISPSTVPAMSALQSLVASPETTETTAEGTTELTYASRKRGNPFSFYVYGGAEGRFVLRNIFLDGNTFGSSHSVAKRHFVDDLKVGAAVHLGKFRVSYTLVRRSPEFKARQDRQQFGSFNILWGRAF